MGLCVEGVEKRVQGLHSDLSGRGTTRAEDAQRTPTQSHISSSILVYEDQGNDDAREGLEFSDLGFRVQGLGFRV